MTQLLLLGAVVVLVAFVVLTRLGPSEGRPAGNTQLATAARVVLVIAVLLVLYLVYRGV